MTTNNENTSAQRDLIKGALLKIDALQTKLKICETEKTEAIAIVGMGCRFPGGADSPEAFWQLLNDGRDAITEVPPERCDINAYYDADADAPGKMNTRYGGFIKHVEAFDPGFFGISPREAVSMDPQQRLLLEVAWEALEHANIPPHSLYGTAAGVFIGIIGQDYAQRLFAPEHLKQIDAYVGTGASLGVAAGRLSYTLGLTGPSFSLDTACSSSLVTLHLACESLRRKECNLALTGGVNLILEPGLSINFSKARMMAPDGRCKTFDGAADGYVRGEGCGILVLKRLSDAVAAGDTILALVRGSAVNQDGPSGGLTVPRGPSQEQVIRQALNNAGIAPDAVSYVEAHGTGTALGDPIELGSLDQVFSPGRANPLYLGSVKTNVGHLEAAAGVAGIIKLVLALQHQCLPAHLHCGQPTPRFPWATQPLRVVRERQAWLRGSQPRIAGTSSFGFSGTNAHIVIEEAPQTLPALPLKESPPQLLTLSARSEAALNALACRYRDHLLAHPDIAPADLCGTAATGRSPFPYRWAITGASTAEFVDSLEGFIDGKTAADKVTETPALAFLFSGQGAQYPGMGQQLYQSQPVFRNTIDRCAEILRPLCAIGLNELLFTVAAECLDQTCYTQPALFCLEYALAELWQSQGVQPNAVLGHSVGEYVAACVAGVFSLEDAIKLLVARASLMQALATGGAMAAVFTSEARVAQALVGYSDTLSIAAVNSAENIVISGEATALSQVLDALQAEAIGHRRLKVSHAFHSPLMEPMLAEFATIAAQIHYQPPALPLISNLTGLPVGDEIATPGYWVEHIRKPVRFADSITTLKNQQFRLFLEIGPKPVLLGMIPDSILIPSLRQQVADHRQYLNALGELFMQGIAIDWNAVYPRQSWQPLHLPTYPFQRQRFWIDSAPSANKRISRVKHPLLGQRLSMPAMPNGEVRYEQTLNDKGYIQDHRVFQQSVLPAAAYIEMALAAASNGTHLPCLEDITIQQALVFSANQDKTVQLVLTQVTQQTGRFEIYSLSDNEPEQWTLHVAGNIATIPSAVPLAVDMKAIRAEFKEEMSIEHFYRQCRQRGIDYGPDFQALQNLWHSEGKALGSIRLPERLTTEIAHYHIHPVLLDACFQVLIASLPESSATWLPMGFEHLQLYQSPGDRLWCRALIHKTTGQAILQADLLLFDNQGEIIGVIEKFKARPADPANLLPGKSDPETWLYGVDWQAQGLCSPRANAALLASPTTLGGALNASMTAWIQQSQLEEYGVGLDELDKLCVDYVLAAFMDMGNVFHPYHVFSSLEIATRLDIVPVHQHFLERTLEMLAEAGILQRIATGWKVLHTPPIVNPQQTAKNLRSRYPQIELELGMTERCGSALAPVLQGQCDPLQELLFPGGDGSALAALYRDPPGAQAVGAVFRLALSSALDRLPQRCGVRILEIGAGTGGASSFLLPHLSAQRTEYIFTDISPAFTLQAQTTFAQYPFIQYQTLDIEKDPQAQGFKLHDYDIVIASNVLHATENLAQTLKHTRSLLAPGGLLLLLEGTAPQNWIDIIFGMTSGWWRFSDKQLRPSHPLLPGQAWCDVLQASGFQQATSIDCTPIHQSIIIAQADAQLADTSPSKSWLIFTDAGGTGLRLSEQLRTTGSACTLVYPGDHYQHTQPDSFTIDPYQASHYQRLFDELGGTTITYCVHLWSLDADIATARLGWETVLHLVQAISKASISPRLVLLTQGAVSVSGEAVAGLAASPVWGMGKSIALEHPELRCIRIDLDTAAQADQIQAVIAEITEESPLQTEDQIAFRGERRWVPRLVRRGAKHSLPQTESYQLNVPATGSLDELVWQAAERLAPDEDEVEIQLHAAGLNFKDLLLALHRVPAAGSVLGIECAGVVVRAGSGVSDFAVGDAVLAMAPGSFSRYVNVPTRTVAALPEGLSFEEAATLPIAFLTAAYALEDLANLQAGERVLIHAATGGVGLAAIQLAQQAGAEVFATASVSKWGVLRALGIKHIMNSRTLDFADEIRRLTDGEGIDVVLNTLHGEFTSRSLALLRTGGRFLEIGITDLRSEEEVAQLAPGVRYHAIDLMRLYQETPALLQSLLQRLMERFSNGQLKPLPRTVFAINEAETAFRTMQQANHTGKLVLSFDTTALPFRKDASYLISGGLGDLGLLVAAWMAEHGAGHLVLAGRRGITSAAEEKIRAISQTGAIVSVFQTDISDPKQLARMLAELEQTLPPLHGIIHAAGVLDDGVLTEQTPERYAKVLAPKLDGAWQLHCQTLSLPLDFFIMFSSATSLLGSVGQSNHVSANAFLDALAYNRLAQGLPALSINWGAWSEIGYAARVQAGDFLKNQGMGTIDPGAGLAALKRVFHSNTAQVGVIPIDWPTYLQRTACSGYLSEFRREFSLTQPGSSEEKAEFRQLFESTPQDERHALLTRHVAAQVATVLGFSASTAIDRKQGFFDMGMDSLTSIELRNRLRTSLGCALPSTLAFDFPSVTALVDYLAKEVLGQVDASPQIETGEERKALEQLTEEQAEAKLLKELEEMGFSL